MKLSMENLKKHLGLFIVVVVLFILGVYLLIHHLHKSTGKKVAVKKDDKEDDKEDDKKDVKENMAGKKGGHKVHKKFHPQRFIKILIFLCTMVWTL